MLSVGDSAWHPSIAFLDTISICIYVGNILQYWLSIFFVNSNHLMSFAEVWSIARTHRSFFFPPDLGKTGLVIMAENLTCSR